MADYAHTETDKRIEELEKRLQAEYRQAYRETKGKLEKYLSDFARKDEAKRKLVDEGKLSQADYKKWRTNQMLTGQRWVKMVDTLARDMNRTNQIAADIINGQLSPTFALNANFAEYLIEEGFRTDYGFTLYNQETVNRLVAENPDLLPAPSVDVSADIRWNKQKITSNITQAVLQGKAIPEIAKAMETVVGMNKASATRNARTAMTGAQNAGRQKVYEDAAERGILKQQEWVATLDGRTRHSHGMADGQRVNVGEPFIVGGYKLRCPGDPHGKAKEIYNCRCSTAPVTKYSEPRITYPEWVQTKEGQAELEKARIERNKKAAKRRKSKKKQQNNAQNGLKSSGNRDKIESRHYDFLDGVLGADALPADKAKNLDEIISVIPKKHLDVIGKTIKRVDYVKGRGHCSYNPVTKTLTLDDKKMNGSIIHEFGHVLADAYDIYNDKEFLNILNNKFDTLEWGEINYYYFQEINDYVYILKSDKLINLYQGRVYADLSDVDYSKPIPLKCFQEYISVGFDAYFNTPDILKEKDCELYKYLRRLLNE